MYNMIKLADLIRRFGESCQRYGICDVAMLPKSFTDIVDDLEM